MPIRSLAHYMQMRPLHQTANCHGCQVGTPHQFHIPKWQKTQSASGG